MTKKVFGIIFQWIFSHGGSRTYSSFGRIFDICSWNKGEVTEARTPHQPLESVHQGSDDAISQRSFVPQTALLISNVGSRTGRNVGTDLLTQAALSTPLSPRPRAGS